MSEDNLLSALKAMDDQNYRLIPCCVYCSNNETIEGSDTPLICGVGKFLVKSLGVCDRFSERQADHRFGGWLK
ncbi:MAG: hypothetical protein WC714_28405 [Candidatus Obscuribacterales bacterium]|jgi:hypothetical protein